MLSQVNSPWLQGVVNADPLVMQHWEGERGAPQPTLVRFTFLE